MRRMISQNWSVIAVAVVGAACSPGSADVTLRIVCYNITSSGALPRAGMDTILQAIGQESVGGRTLPLDILSMQEVQTQATTGQNIVTMLNGLYGAGTYARGTLDGATTGAGTQGVVYNATKLQLVNEATIGVAGTAPNQPRQTLRYKFHPIGAPATADFYLYSSHWKASNDSTSLARKLVEATAIRADADALGQGAAILYTGDYNVYLDTEAAFGQMIAAGNGQAFDPVNRIGAWTGNPVFRDVFTQAPAVSPPSGLTGGGLDDRFDWQMVTGEVLAGTPGVLTYIAGSYHTFGNNGTVVVDGNINDASNTALAGLANRLTVLNLLTTVSDHLPVVADYIIVLPGACCLNAAGTCTMVIESACGAGSTFNGGASCSPNPCSQPTTGACCNGTACSVSSQAACTGAFQGASSTCGLSGNPTTCCPANFNATNGLSVQDIFDFLAAYFGADPRADFNTSGAISVQDIFDFLAAYFAGCA